MSPLDDTPPVPGEADAPVLPEPDGSAQPLLPPVVNEDPNAQRDERHFENLADQLDDTFLDTLAKRLIAQTQRNFDSAEEWRNYYAKGIEQLGYDRSMDERDMPFPGASAVVHPLLSESQIDFAARAMKTLWPANGPVATKITGKQTPAKEDQAARVRDLMNFDLTQVPEYRAEQDTMMMVLPIAGSAFKKTFWDQTVKRFRDEFVMPDNFVVNYGERYLDSCPFYTHTMAKNYTAIRRMQAAGVWRDVDIGHPSNDDTDNDRVTDVNKRIEGIEPSPDSDDGDYELHETTVDLDDDDLRELEAEKPPDIPLSYVVTLVKETGKVLALRRNWKPQDDTYPKIVSFTHYKCFPWTGFYGIGLCHVMGGIARAATGALRAELDSAMVSAVPSGIRLRGGRVSGANIAFRPFQWTEIDSPGVNDINKIAMSLPTKGPDPILFELIQYLDKKGAEFASVASQSISDGQANLPVGSVLALIEQDSVVYSAIHARLHASLADELQKIADLYRENLDDQVTRETFGGELIASWRDFVGVTVVPVSDPRIFSETQRVGRAQARLQLVEKAKADGVGSDARMAYVEMARTLDFDDPEDMFPEPASAVPLDPVSEIGAMIVGKPVSAFPGQDHKSHVAFLTATLQDPQYAQLLPKIGPQWQDLICQHLGLLLHDEIQLKLGQPLPPMGQQQPPQIAAQISMAVAGAEQAMSAARQAQAAQAQQPPQQDQGETAVEMAEVRRREQADQLKRQTDLDKIASTEKQAADKLHVTVAVEDAKIQSSEKIAAAELSTDLIAKLGQGSDHPDEIMNNEPEPEVGT